MQMALDLFIRENPSENGYFTIIQHDDGSMLRLPPNTVVYGACNGNIPLPLIYEDKEDRLVNRRNKTPKTFREKSILCSFVGTTTHNIRRECIKKLQNKPGFEFVVREGWSSNVNTDLQEKFIELTLNSKFALAPRGYGRSSFRFFEIFKLGSIPIYVWDDIEWLPYLDIVDYNKFCISIHSSEIDELPSILGKITEERYERMWQEYEKIKNIFELDFICKYITDPVNVSGLNLNNADMSRNIVKKDYPDKISLCITTMNRYEEFLSKSLDYYIDYLKEGLIDELIICDETGEDYEKVMKNYEKYISENPNKMKKAIIFCLFVVTISQILKNSIYYEI